MPTNDSDCPGCGDHTFPQAMHLKSGEVAAMNNLLESVEVRPYQPRSEAPAIGEAQAERASFELPSEPTNEGFIIQPAAPPEHPSAQPEAPAPPEDELPYTEMPALPEEEPPHVEVPPTPAIHFMDENPSVEGNSSGFLQLQPQPEKVEADQDKIGMSEDDVTSILEKGIQKLGRKGQIQTVRFPSDDKVVPEVVKWPGGALPEDELDMRCWLDSRVRISWGPGKLIVVKHKFVFSRFASNRTDAQDWCVATSFPTEKAARAAIDFDVPPPANIGDLALEVLNPLCDSTINCPKPCVCEIELVRLTLVVIREQDFGWMKKQEGFEELDAMDGKSMIDVDCEVLDAADLKADIAEEAGLDEQGMEETTLPSVSGGRISLKDAKYRAMITVTYTRAYQAAMIFDVTCQP